MRGDERATTVDDLALVCLEGVGGVVEADGKESLQKEVCHAVDELRKGSVLRLGTELGFDEADLSFDSQAGQKFGLDVASRILRGRDGAGKQGFGDFNGDLEVPFGSFDLKAVTGGARLHQHFRNLGFVEGRLLDPVTAV